MPDTMAASWSWTRTEMAARLAQDIPDGWHVNLGIGIPTLVANGVPPGREVVFQSENGLLGMGPAPDASEADPWLINAGKQACTLLPGGSYFHQADSFGMIRGRHLDLCVLGAFEVAGNGDIANWTTGETGGLPAVGGAMDLAVGARRLWVLMEHATREGRPRIVERCGYPLTAVGTVGRVYTNLAVLEVLPEGGFRVLDMAPGVTLGTLQERTQAHLQAPA